MGMGSLLIGALAGIVLTSCARTRSAEQLCEKSSAIKDTTSLVRTIGKPDRESHGDPAPGDVDVWAYDGVDGVCLITVEKNVVGPMPTFLPSGPGTHN
jgi:hypothetical protein